jgi:hypothetical protein
MAQSLENLDCKVSFAVGDGKVMVAYKTFMQFKTMNTMCEDLELTMDNLDNFPKLPSIRDASNIPINFTNERYFSGGCF